jgi:hypothetical protein
MFREKLRVVKKDIIFAKSTFNDTWGAGLDNQGSKNTKVESWPGQKGKSSAKRLEKGKKVTNGANHI